MAPIAPPPGLEAVPRGRACGKFGPRGGADLKEAYAKDAMFVLSPDVAELVRKAFLSDVETEVAGRLAQVWQHGAMSMMQAQEQHAQHSQQLMTSVAQLGAAQKAMEAENDRLRQVAALVSARLAQLAKAQMVPGCYSPSEGSTGAPTPLSSRASSALPSPTGARPVSLAAAVRPPPPAMAPMLPQALNQKPSKSLSLADALGLKVFDATIPAAPSRPPSPPLSAAPMPEDMEVDAFIFTVTIHVADGLELGLQLSPSGPPGRCCTLKITRVLSGGAAEAWNRQFTAANTDRALRVGDLIVAVNDIAGDSNAMSEECRVRQLLRFQIVRNNNLLPPPMEASCGVAAPILSLEALVGSPKRLVPPPASPPPLAPPAFVPTAASSEPFSPPPAHSVAQSLGEGPVPKALGSRFDSVCEFVPMTVVKLSDLVL